MRDELVGLLGEAGPGQIRREKPRHPQDDAHADQCRRDDGTRPPADGRSDVAARAVFWPNGPGFSLTCTAPGLTGGVRRRTGTITPGASMLANRIHAADQPSGVSGHRSSGCDRGAPVVQMP